MKEKTVVEKDNDKSKNTWILKLGVSLLLGAGVLYYVVEYTLAIFMFNVCVILLVLVNFEGILNLLKRFGLIKEEKVKK